ncbi:MAG: hypothetical protein M3N93_08120 [Acidobacteriota bacterium]|nr:hypothetical protein [Acidobacteriota bacterium]
MLFHLSQAGRALCGGGTASAEHTPELLRDQLVDGDAAPDLGILPVLSR